MRENKKLFGEIDKAKAVSFDIFDTLVKRNVSRPKDIFHIVEERYRERTGKTISEFYDNRIMAERKKRTTIEEGDVSLDQIYEFMPYSAEEKEILKKLEIETEVDYCQANLMISPVYNYVANSGKQIFILSDMYLPEEVMKKLLKKCGYNIYKKLYVSSECGSSKADGSMYTTLLCETGMCSGDILHIGDNIHSDIINAKLKGLRTFHIKKDQIATVFLKFNDIYTGNKSITPFLNNNIIRYDDNNDIYKLGYEVLGPLLLGFASWIHKEATEQKRDRLYFLARDTYLLRSAFEILYKDMEITYLEVSRKSLRVAYIQKKRRFDAIFDTLSRKKYTIYELLEALDITIDDYIRKCANYKIDSGDAQYDSMQLKDKELIDSIILNIVLNEKDYALDYLNKMGLDSDRSIIVDIGWHGTIQKMLEAICDLELYGLYFGNTKRSGCPKNNAKGYWFDNDDERTVRNELAITYILETMLFPDKGTTLGYKVTENDIVPCYAEFKQHNKDLIRLFQQGAIRFVKDYRESGPNMKCFNADESTLAYEHMAFQPTLKVAELFGNLRLEDGKMYQLARADNLFGYVIQPSKFIKDYIDARWKEGFIKQIFPLIRDPHRIACIIKKRDNLA